MRKYFLYILILFRLTLIHADFSFQSIIDDYYRFEEISGLKDISSKNYNIEELVIQEFNYLDPFSFNKEVFNTDNISILLTSPQVFMSYNFLSPFGNNDRVAFQGKGFNSSVITGFKFVSDIFSIKFNPEVFFSQNLDYDIIPTEFSSGYGDYWTIFDNLQRHGDDPFYYLSLGQSALKFNLFNTTLSIGTENIETAFNRRNSFLLSNHADGFPHIDLGTQNDVKIKYFGDIEAKMMWGVITESEYFDDDPDNDDAWISGLFMGYTPAFMPNLKLGFNHLYTTPMSEWGSNDLIAGIPGVDWVNTPAAEGDNDMMVSLAFRWVFPESGFELYGEWARNDNFTNFKQLYNFPEHTQAYTVGFSKILGHPTKNSSLQFSSEYSDARRQRTVVLSPAGPWYRHAFGGWTQGYTNGGQIIGASIGPGGENLWLEIKLTTEKAIYAITGERFVLDKDWYYMIKENGTGDLTGEEVGQSSEFNWGFSALHIFEDFALYSNLTYNLNFDENFVNMDHVNNFHLELGIALTF
ncbi:MAG: capsule assembly Wzi family protein [Spirochaetaceae bacterium]